MAKWYLRKCQGNCWVQKQKEKFETQETSHESFVIVHECLSAPTRLSLSHTRFLGTKQSPLQTDRFQIVPPPGRQNRKRCPFLWDAADSKACVQAWWGGGAQAPHPLWLAPRWPGQGRREVNVIGTSACACIGLVSHSHFLTFSSSQPT